MPMLLRITLLVAILVLAGYLLLCLLVFIFQNKLAFVPSRSMMFEPSQLPVKTEDVYIEVGDRGERINGWYFPVADSAPVILFCHGNAGNISNRLEHVELFQKLRLNAFFYDYRGYGKSDGSPSESRAYEDAEAAYRWLVEVKKVDPSKIVLFGESIGGAMALHTATKVKVGGLVLESTITSAKEMGQRMFPFLPIGVLLRVEFDNLTLIDRITVPLLITHSRTDDIVPYDMGRRLFMRAPQPKRFVDLQGGHNDREYVTNSQYSNGLRWLIGQVTGTATGVNSFDI